MADVEPAFPQFLAVGDRVVTTARIVETGSPEFQNHVHAEVGELGTCVHAQEGYLPTVRFDRTKTATIVFEMEVEKVVLH